ncbi:hypothetical protein D3C80_1171310 [compost metagenome]
MWGLVEFVCLRHSYSESVNTSIKLTDVEAKCVFASLDRYNESSSLFKFGSQIVANTLGDDSRFKSKSFVKCFSSSDPLRMLIISAFMFSALLNSYPHRPDISTTSPWLTDLPQVAICSSHLSATTRPIELSGIQPFWYVALFICSK